MTVTIKTAAEQDKMRIAGRLASEVLDMIEDYVKPGISTGELDRICHEFITVEQDAVPAPLNYRGFPKSICTSVNHVVCHGIPGEKTLKSGDEFMANEGHFAANRVVAYGVTCCALGADEENGAAIGDRSLDERTGFARHRQALLKVDNMDFVSFAEDVGCHLRVPETGLMTKMHASL